MRKRFGPRDSEVAEWNADRQQGHFLPSFSIRRHVNLEDGVADELHKEMLKNLKFKSERYKVPGYVVSPEQMCLVLVEQQSLIHQMRVAGVKPDRKDSQELPRRVEELAGNVQLGLSRLLQNRPSTLEVPLGRPRLFDAARTVGCEPNGWRGWGANYMQRGGARTRHEQMPRTENLSPNALLVSEKSLCIGAIELALGDMGHHIDMNPLHGTPHIAFMRRNASLRNDKFLELEQRLSEILPEELTLDDPVIDLQLYRDEPPQSLPVWPREMSGGRLRLVA